tara:strand:+ start:3062 stop:3469 length:408 start_codon:yes stop_codon:yes gene_type:complete
MDKRSEGQKQVLIMMKQEFVDEVDAHAESIGLDRSTFIRNAVYDEMISSGVIIDPRMKSAPSRKGKGGPKKKPTSSENLMKVAEDEASYSTRRPSIQDALAGESELQRSTRVLTELTKTHDLSHLVESENEHKKA